MTSSARLDDLQQKFAADPRRYFAPLANEFRKRGDAGRAVELCRTYLPQQPGHLSGHVVLAQALHDLAQRDAARQAYEDALALDPENVLVLRSLGDLAREGGDAALARGWYDRAMGLDPRDPDVAQRVAALEQMPPHAAAPTAMGFTAALVAANARHAADDDRKIEPAAFAESDDVDRPLAAPVEPDDASTAATADRAEADDQREAADFTAGFFAAVLDEEPEAPSAHRTAEPGQAMAPDAHEPFTDQPEVPSSSEADDIDRLFDEMPPLFPGADLGSDAGAAPDAPLPLGTDLALMDGGGIVADLPASHDLPESPGDRSAASEGPSLAFEDALFIADEGPAPLVADGEPQSLDELGSEYVVDLPAGATAGETADAVEPQPLVEVTDSLELAPPDAADEPTDDAGTAPVEQGGADVVLEGMDDAADAAPVATTAAYADAAHEHAGDAPYADAPSAFVTETMAELYRRQGFPEQALSVYRQLAAQRPDDVRLAGLVEELSHPAPAVAETPPAAPVEAGRRAEPVAVSWLRRLAVARPTPQATPLATPAATPVTESRSPGEEEPAGEEPAVVAAFEWARPAAESETDGATGVADVVGERSVAMGGEASVGTGAPVEVVAESAGPRDDPEADDPWVFDGELMSGTASYPSAPAPQPTPTTPDDLPVADEPAAAEAGIDTAADTTVPHAERAPAAATLEEILARPAAEHDEIAAGALVAATLSLQADPAVDAMLGESVAEDPGALQHMLRATPRSVAALRQGASFSFEQFFRPEEARPSGEQPGAPRALVSAEAAPASAPDEESARDLAEFHAWLAGLGDS